MDFVLGGISAAGAVVLTNPMDVVKTRMQLQGELRARGGYAVVYKNFFRAALAIAKADGVPGLQKGLSAAMSYQMLVNSIRLGMYRTVLDSGLISRPDGSVAPLGSLLAGMGAGTVGALVSNPIVMVKTHLQSQAAKSIAVGHQHQYTGLACGVREVWRAGGVRGLWRGWQTFTITLSVGSALQLFTYSMCKDLVDHLFQYKGANE